MIPIFMASDEKFAKYMSVTIQSIISNTDEKISFYVLDGGISDETKNKIASIVQNSVHSVEFIQVDKSMFEDFPEIRHFSINTYFRYLIPGLKPELDKVLYIDADMTIVGDINEIYNVSMDNRGIAAVPYMDEEYNPNLYKSYKKTLGLSEGHEYFNAGLLIIDCDYWRRNNISDKLFAKTNELKNVIAMPDQDILNIIFENNYKKLPNKFNYVVDLTSDYIDFQQELKNIQGCYVLHYTGGRNIRPWMSKGIIGEEYFWSNAKHTPFFEDLKFDLITNQNLLINKLLSEKINKPNKYKILLFNFIPFIKIHKKQHKIYIKLFNFIPIFKILN